VAKAKATRRAGAGKARRRTTPAASPRKPAATGPRRKVKAAPRKVAAPRPRRKASGDEQVFGVEVEPSSVEKTLARVRKELAHWVNKGRYTKVRFKLRGRPILPDLPVAAVVAAEAVTFWWTGLLRALLVTLGANAVLDVELVNDADREVARGREALLGGDLDRAIDQFGKALQMDRNHPAAHLSLGIAYKLKGDRDRARELLQRSEQLDPEGPSGEEARRLLDQLAGAPEQGARPTP
jgi:tetratricopeptide (TPR) repeat protein